MNRLILNTDFIKIALILGFFAFLAPVLSIAQTSTCTVSGIVKGDDGVPLPSASVYTTEDTKFGASTDSKGKFRIDLPHAGPWTVKCSMVGFVSKEYLLLGNLHSGICLQLAHFHLKKPLFQKTQEPLIF